MARRRGGRGKGGHLRFNPVMMFKILVLQVLYSLSDEGCELQIKDCLSFYCFLGLGLDGRVPDSTTVCLLREWLMYPPASAAPLRGPETCIAAPKNFSLSAQLLRSTRWRQLTA